MRKDVRNQRENETQVVCPKCGAEFAIAEKTHVTIGIAIGKDAGLGTIPSSGWSGQTCGGAAEVAG